MLDFRWKYYTIIFGTLLTLVACQKIDEETINPNGADSTSKDNTETTAGNDKDKKNNKDQTSINSEGHTIAMSEDTGDGKRVLYVSLLEWNDVPSARCSGDDGTKAKSLAENYIEGNLTGWRIPTKEEARLLKTIYGCDFSTESYSPALTELNTRITESGGVDIDAWGVNGDPFRYLCDDGYYSFSLKNGSTIAQSASTLKTKYNLRLVKDSTIIQN